MENRRDALHGLLAVGRAAEGGKTEVSLASRTKANARRTYYLGLLKSKKSHELIWLGHSSQM